MTAIDLVDRRYLAGLLVRDATTGAPVLSPLSVSSDSARFFRNASGLFVVSSAVGLEAHLLEFEAPPATPVGSVPVEIAIRDPLGFYFPRLFTLDLPRSPDPLAADSMLQPVRIDLYRSAGAPLSANWSAVDATLVDIATGAPVRNALVRVVRQSDQAVLGVGLLMAGVPDPRISSARTIGQLTIPIVGIPVVAWSDTADAVLISSVAILLQVVPISPSLTAFDPDAFITAPGTTVGPFNIAAGRRVNAGILQVTVPN